jgi:hypothetical protein
MMAMAIINFKTIYFNLIPKNMKKINIYHTLLLLVGVLFFHSCTENTDYPETRLFRPVLNSALLAQNNTITVDMAKMTKAVSYKIEISRDNFTTVLGTFESPNNKIVITNLLWNTKYYVRATAFAATTEFNSKVSDLGSTTTERFPSIMQIPTAADVTDVAAKVKWLTGVTSGALVTQVKVFAIADEALTTPLATYAVTAAEQTAGAKIVNGLTPTTQYQLAIYSGDTVRGWEKYTTRDPLPTGASVVDLRGIVPTPTTLYNALVAAPAGATIILDGDATYTIDSGLVPNIYKFNKSLTIKSGYSINSTTGAIIDNSVTGFVFELAETSSINSIVFDGISFVGDAALSRYVMNAAYATSTTVGELKFVNCKMTNFRDLIRSRVQWTSGGISQLTVDNCIITNISSNGVAIVDGGALNPFPNIAFKNSTFSKIQKLINNKCTSNTNTLTISDCTFAETPSATGALLSYGSTTNILSPILITNTIFGGAASNVAFSFITSGHLKATLISSNNTYSTNDVTFTPPTTTTPLPAFTVYPGSTTALWMDPLNGSFYFKDSAFPGTKTCGDPRWRK